MTLRFEAADEQAAAALAATVDEARGLAALYADETGEYRLLKKL